MTPKDFLTAWLAEMKGDGVTQQTLADASGVHQSLVSANCRGEKPISPEVAAKYDNGSRALAGPLGKAGLLAEDLCPGEKFERDPETGTVRGFLKLVA